MEAPPGTFPPNTAMPGTNPVTLANVNSVPPETAVTARAVGSVPEAVWFVSSWRMPALRVTPPLKVLLPVSESMPLPSLMSPAGEKVPPITF
jgi:hypothetical protein